MQPFLHFNKRITSATKYKARKWSRKYETLSGSTHAILKWSNSILEHRCIDQLLTLLHMYPSKSFSHHHISIRGLTHNIGLLGSPPTSAPRMGTALVRLRLTRTSHISRSMSPYSRCTHCTDCRTSPAAPPLPVVLQQCRIVRLQLS